MDGLLKSPHSRMSRIRIIIELADKTITMDHLPVTLQAHNARVTSSQHNVVVANTRCQQGMDDTQIKTSHTGKSCAAPVMLVKIGGNAIPHSTAHFAVITRAC